MDNDFEHDGFHEVSALEDLSVLSTSGSLSLEESSADSQLVEETAAATFQEAETQSRYGSYGVVMRQRPLLTAKQELTLGRELENARQEMTQALARLPLSSRLLARAWEEALESDRPIS